MKIKEKNSLPSNFSKQEEFNSSAMDTYRITKELVENKLITYDKATNTIIFNTDVNFKFKGNVNIDSNKHIILSSGQTLDPGMGYPYSVCLNPKYEEDDKISLDPRIMIDTKV